MTCISKNFSFYPGEDKDLKISLILNTDGCRDIRRLIPMVRASLIVQDLTFTAIPISVDGNSITIEYTVGATAGAEVVTVIGNAISVQIEDSVSTADQVKAAIEINLNAAALVTIVVSGTGTTAQVAAVATALAGGLGDFITVTVPASPDDWVFNYNSNPIVEIIDEYLGQIKVQLTDEETNLMIDGPILVNVTDDSGKTQIYKAAGVVKLEAGSGC